eukprot:TRINITY_DN36081_c0_g1_i1.p1 TRINITY_DN36081_c0_g1~~TRINITY_DN36081_c0_g1_i1.p1  ORF type:complete len:642 (+),score=138.80 TRINITY_DN36081_c0_g1_i1:152-2077(+)
MEPRLASQAASAPSASGCLAAAMWSHSSRQHERKVGASQRRLEGQCAAALAGRRPKPENFASGGSTCSRPSTAAAEAALPSVPDIDGLPRSSAPSPPTKSHSHARHCRDGGGSAGFGCGATLQGTAPSAVQAFAALAFGGDATAAHAAARRSKSRDVQRIVVGALSYEENLAAKLRDRLRSRLGVADAATAQMRPSQALAGQALPAAPTQQAAQSTPDLLGASRRSGCSPLRMQSRSPVRRQEPLHGCGAADEGGGVAVGDAGGMRRQASSRLLLGAPSAAARVLPPPPMQQQAHRRASPERPSTSPLLRLRPAGLAGLETPPRLPTPPPLPAGGGPSPKAVSTSTQVPTTPTRSASSRSPTPPPVPAIGDEELKVCSEIFEEIIRRDAQFGSALRKVKNVYDAFVRQQGSQASSRAALAASPSLPGRSVAHSPPACSRPHRSHLASVPSEPQSSWGGAPGRAYTPPRSSCQSQSMVTVEAKSGQSERPLHRDLSATILSMPATCWLAEEGDEDVLQTASARGRLDDGTSSVDSGMLPQRPPVGKASRPSSVPRLDLSRVSNCEGDVADAGVEEELRDASLNVSYIDGNSITPGKLGQAGCSTSSASTSATSGTPTKAGKLPQASAVSLACGSQTFGYSNA